MATRDRRSISLTDSTARDVPVWRLRGRRIPTAEYVFPTLARSREGRIPDFDPVERCLPASAVRHRRSFEDEMGGLLDFDLEGCPNVQAVRFYLP